MFPRAQKRYSRLQQVYDGDDEASNDGVLESLAEPGKPGKGCIGPIGRFLLSFAAQEV